MPTTPQGVEADDTIDTPTTVDGASDAFLKRWTDAGALSDTDEGAKPTAKGAEIAPNDADEDESDELILEDEDDDANTGDDGAEDDGEGDPKVVEATDDAVVKVTIDGEERSVSVKDLKRLYGQEASLTRKSQEVAQARKKAEDEGAYFVAATGKLLEKAQSRFAPYEKVDWAIAQKTLTNEEFVALRQEAVAAYEEVQFLEGEAHQVLESAAQARAASMQEAAKECIEVLERDIPNWSRETYDSIRSYAVGAGLAENEVNQVVNPTILKMLYYSMRYEAAVEKAKTKKKAVAPTKVIKSSKRSATVMGKQTNDAEMKRLSQTGSKEDAANAFLARWATQDD